MATEYEVNIKLNTRNLTKDLDTVGKKISNLGKTQNNKAKNALNSTDAVLKKEIAILATENRALRTKGQLLKLERSNFNVKDQIKKLDLAIDVARRGEVDMAKVMIQKREKAIILSKNQLITEGKITEQKQKQVALSTGIASPVFGKPTQIGSPSNIAAILNDPTTSASPVQQALAKMEERSAANQKQAMLNRKKSLSLGKANLKIVQNEVKAESEKVRLIAEQNKLDNRIAMSGISPSGAFSRLSDRQSRDAQGKRTFMNNPVAGFMGRRFGTTRGFDAQSAIISGGFPLLFGQGPVTAAAGALGGGIGGMFGQMGGFAGGIAATAAAQAIIQSLTAISELGQALGPFTQNSEAAVTALGLQGSAEEARIKLIEQSQGKQAAFNASMTTMTALIGQKGVDSLKDFGETTRLMNSQFTLAIAKIQAFTSRLINFVIQLTGLEDGLTTAAATQSVAIAAAEGDSVAQDLVARREALSGMSGQGGSGIRRKQLENEIIKEERLFAIRRNTSIEADKVTATFDEMVNKINQEEELSQRILELRRDGLNPEIAKTIAKLEEEADKSKDSLQIKIDELKRKKEAGNLDKRALTELEEKISNLEKEKDAVDSVVDSTKDQVKAQHDLTNAAKQTLDAFDKMKTTIQGDIKDGIKGLIKGTSTLGDLLNNVADRFLDLALNQALFGNAGGETVTGGLFKAIGFKAKGGPVRGGSSYVVGERGPELFTPGVSGNITPNNQMGGSTSVVVNVDASGTSAEGDQASGEELGRLIGAAVQAELIKERRPGGLLG